MQDFEDVAPWVAPGYDILSVEINGNITSIGDSAFYGCKNLKEFTIPNTVNRIGAFAFYECNSLSQIKVPNTVKEIGGYAFGYLYNADSGEAVLLDGFKMLVSKPSKAFDYARNYEVPHEVYESTGKEPAENNEESNGIALWVWVLIGLGAVVLVGTISLLVFVRKKKGKTEVQK